jgi:hypothetical protein
MALEEYEQYVTDKKLAAVGLADDPSIGWLPPDCLCKLVASR